MQSDFSRIKALFSESLEQPAQQREAWIRSACADDAELCKRVLSLAASQGDARQFFDRVLGPFSSAQGQQVGAYRLAEPLATGGMAAVHLAERVDGQYEQLVAIKLLRTAGLDEHLLARFHAERQILASLEHRNIARLLDSSVTDAGVPYFVMEYVDGVAIDTHCDRNSLTTRQRLTLMRTICRAVTFAHSRLVIHRDLKPANILVNRDGEVKLLDFGIARLLDRSRDRGASLTQLYDERPLTPAYAAPEQWLKQQPSTATDVYALGVLLFLLLSGEMPCTDEELKKRGLNVAYQPAMCSMAAAVRLRDDDTKERAASLRGALVAHWLRDLDGDLHNIVSKALEPDPARRYETVEAFDADIERYLTGHMVEARPVTLRYRCTRWLQRNWLPVGLTSVFLLLAAALAGLSVNFGIRSGQQAVALAQARDNADQVALVLAEVFEAANPDLPESKNITAREALTSGSARVIADLRDQPAVQWRVLAIVGSIFKKLGAHQQAEQPLRQALAAYARMPPALTEDAANQKALVEATNNLGDVLLGLGKYDEAEPYLRDALALARELAGKDDAAVLNALNSLVEMHNSARRFDQGEILAREAVALADRLQGEAFRVRAMAYNNYGVIGYHTRPIESVEAAFAAALALQNEGLPPHHPETSRTKANLAGVLVTLNQHDRAAALYRQVIASNQYQGTGPSLSLAQALYGLGAIHLSRGEPAAAVDLLARSVEVNSVFKSGEHYELLLQRFMLAVAHSGLGDYDAAYAILEPLRETALRRFPTKSLTARIQVHMAAIAIERGQLAWAQALMASADGILDALDSPRAWHTAYADAVHGRLMARAGNRDAAGEKLRASLDILRDHYGSEATLIQSVEQWQRDLR